MPHSLLYARLLRLLNDARREAQGDRNYPVRSESRRRGWSRRRVLGGSSAVLGAGLLGTPGLLAGTVSAAPSSGPAPRIAIVGAGLAGLTAAYHLRQAGFEATVFEGRQRIGGRILSIRDGIGDDLVSDLGGSFINTDHRDILDLSRTFGLKLFNRRQDTAGQPFPATAYAFGGRLVGEAELADLLRPLALRIGEDADRLDQDFDRFAPRFDRFSVADYLDRHQDKIGAPFVRVLIENSIRSEYGVEPDQSSLLQLLFNLPTVDGDRVEVLGNSDEVFVFRGGTSRLVEALGAALGGQIRLQRKLKTIEQRGSGFRLTFRVRPTSGGNDTETVDADHVILAIPFTTLRRVEVLVDLPRRLRRFIDEARLGTNEKVIAGFTNRAWRQAGGFNQEIWTDEGFTQAWDDTQRQSAKAEGGLIFYLGGDQTATLEGSTATAVGQSFVDRLDQVLPGVATAANGRFIRTRWSNDRFLLGAYSSYAPGQLTTFADLFWIDDADPALRQEVAVGNLVFAGEHLSDAFFGFMNGAAETGRLAADRVVRTIAGATALARAE
jgi:monoamine oxidase